MRSSLGGRVTEGILVSRRVDDKVLAGDGEPATLEALKEENQQHRLASDQLHAILDQGLFMARLELDKETFERILTRMRKAGAQIDLDDAGEPQP